MRRDPKRLFSEDECLRHDPDYPGIHGWWEERFPGHKFSTDWKAEEANEVDHGDSFVRIITIDGVHYEVTYSFDGYHVRYCILDPIQLVKGIVADLERENALNGGCNIMSRVLLYLQNPVQYGMNRQKWGTTVCRGM